MVRYSNQTTGAFRDLVHFGVVVESGRVELLCSQESDQHGRHPQPEGRGHLRVPGAGSYGGRVWTFQRKDVLSDYD